MNEYFYDLAKQAALAAANAGLLNLDPRWIYAQWCHETAGFTSAMCVDYKNLGGLTQVAPNDTPQPDGDYYYMQFDTYEEYAAYFGRYLKGFIDGGIDQASTLEEYITALKDSPSGAYFGDSLENYLTNCQQIYEECFGA